MLLGYADLLLLHRDALTRLDSAIGDGDHGINMERGAIAMREVLTDAPLESPSGLLQTVGDALLEGIGGAAGPLYASFFFGAARASVDLVELTPMQLAVALKGGVTELAARGRAELGDKTMLDASGPATQAILVAAVAGGTLPEVLLEGRRAANQGRDSTEPMKALKGRASYLGPRSIGHIDPGAASMALLFDALAAIARGD